MYIITMDTDDENIDKDVKKTRGTIYEEIYEPYFGEVKIFAIEFLEHF